MAPFLPAANDRELCGEEPWVDGVLLDEHREVETVSGWVFGGVIHRRGGVLVRSSGLG